MYIARHKITTLNRETTEYYHTKAEVKTPSLDAALFLCVADAVGLLKCQLRRELAGCEGLESMAYTAKLLGVRTVKQATRGLFTCNVGKLFVALDEHCNDVTTDVNHEFSIEKRVGGQPVFMYNVGKRFRVCCVRLGQVEPVGDYHWEMAGCTQDTLVLDSDSVSEQADSQGEDADSQGPDADNQCDQADDMAAEERCDADDDADDDEEDEQENRPFSIFNEINRIDGATLWPTDLSF